jgi:AraC-like DNA-binding protein
MLTERLQDAGLRGLGSVLSGPPGPEEGYEASRLRVAPGGMLTQYRSREDAIVDYGEGMPLLVLYQGESRRVFYLDRAVLLLAGTVFSVVPLGAECAADLYTRPGAPAGRAGEVAADFLAGSVSQLRFGQIVTFFYQQAARDFYFRGERHEPFELVLVDQGKLHNLVNGRDVLLGQQELLIIDRGAWHMQFSDAPVRFLTISFELAGGSLAPVVGKALRLPQSVRPAVEKMLRERTEQGLCSYDYLAALLQILLIELLRAEQSGRRSAAPALPATARAENQIVDRALQLLSGRVGQKLTLGELAAAVNVSIPYLCKLFGEHLGMPPGKYLSKIRLEECRVLLREGELSMGEIAGRMGFSSPQHFSRQFRQWFGMSPSEYARSLKKE